MPRLHVTSLTSIGAVEAGDNPEAEILFWKSQTPNPAEGRTNGGGQVSDTLDLSSLDDEQAAPIKAHVAEMEKHAAELETRISELENVDDEETLPDNLPDVVKERLEDQTSAIAKAEARADKLEERLAKAEDARLLEQAEVRAEELQPILGPDMGPVIKNLTANAPDDWAKLDEQLEVILKLDSLSDVLREYGDNAATGSAIDQINVYATELRKEDKELTAAKARAQAWREHPELKDQAREEGD